jgi:endogenous inhibitor of DNA gyrase (YacG/DUF329 family)
MDGEKWNWRWWIFVSESRYWTDLRSETTLTRIHNREVQCSISFDWCIVLHHGWFKRWDACTFFKSKQFPLTIMKIPRLTSNQWQSETSFYQLQHQNAIDEYSCFDVIADNDDEYQKSRDCASINPTVNWKIYQNSIFSIYCFDRCQFLLIDLTNWVHE